MQLESESPEQASSLAFLGRSAVLNALFAVEAGASFLLDVVLAAAFGLSIYSDALYAAWALPQKIGRGMFQSLTNSFMGIFGERTDRSVAYNQAITVIAAAALPLSAILSATSAWWLPITIPGAAAETQRIAVSLAQIMAWLVGLLALAETCRAVYYQEGKMWLPSLARVVGVIASVALIATAWHEQNLVLAAWAMTVGAGVEAALGLVCMPPVLKYRYRPTWPAWDRLREIVSVVGGPLAGNGANVVAGMAEQMLASLLPAGSITAANYAKRIINTLERFVFRGFLINTIRSHSESSKPDLRAHFRLVMLVAVPVTVMVAALPVPLVSVAFGRGQFGSADVQTLAMAIQVYAPAIVVLALGRVPIGFAYARKKVGALLISAVIASATVVAATAAFIFMGLGLRSFGLGTTVASAVSLTWLYFRIIRFQPVQVWNRRDVLRIAAVGLITWAGTAALSQASRMLAASPATSDLLAFAVGMLGCGAFFAASAYALKFDEVRQLARLLRRGRR
jgi:putative peptidoglycan lipid II flippase